MPHDKNGRPIAVGDAVIIPATVTQVWQGEDACNAEFEVDASEAAPDEYRPTISMNTRLVLKLEAAETEQAE